MKKVILLLIVIATIVSCKKETVTPIDKNLQPPQKPLDYKSAFLASSSNSYSVTDIKVIIDSDTLGIMGPNHLTTKNAADIYASKVVPGNAVLRPVEFDKEFTIKVMVWGTTITHTFTGKIVKNIDETLTFHQTSEWQTPNTTGSGILDVTPYDINGTIVFVLFIS